LDDPVARLVVETRDQAEAAGVSLIVGTVQPEIAGARIDARRVDALQLDARRIGARRIVCRAATCVNDAEFCGKTITYKSVLGA